MNGVWLETLLDAVIVGALAASVVLAMLNSRTARLLSIWTRPDRH